MCLKFETYCINILEIEGKNSVAYFLEILLGILSCVNLHNMQTNTNKINSKEKKNIIMVIIFVRVEVSLRYLWQRYFKLIGGIRDVCKINETFA